MTAERYTMPNDNSLITVDPFAEEVVIPEGWGYEMNDKDLLDEVILNDEYEEGQIEEALAFADALSITYKIEEV